MGRRRRRCAWGDILEEITFGESPPARAPFKGGRDAVMKLLHAAFQRSDSSVLVRARRGERSATPYLEVHARTVPHPPAGRRQFLLLSIRNPNYAIIALVDRSESECIASLGRGLPWGGQSSVRLWYAPTAGEMALEIKMQEGDTKLGFAISRTEEGFIYVSSVTDDDRREGVEAPRRLTGREREGASLESLHLGRHPLLRHRLPQPEAIAAPARTEAHSASLAHVRRVCVRCSTSGRVSTSPLLWRNPVSFVPGPPASNRAGGPTAPPQHFMSRNPSEEEAVTPPLPSLAPPSPADEVSPDAMIGRYILCTLGVALAFCSCHGLMATTTIDDGCCSIPRFP